MKTAYSVETFCSHKDNCLGFRYLPSPSYQQMSFLMTSWVTLTENWLIWFCKVVGHLPIERIYNTCMIPLIRSDNFQHPVKWVSIYGLQPLSVKWCCDWQRFLKVICIIYPVTRWVILCSANIDCDLSEKIQSDQNPILIKVFLFVTGI